MDMQEKNVASFCHFYVRPFANPSNSLPFNARSVGHRKVNVGYIEDVQPRNVIELFWCITGSAEILIEDQIHFLEPDSVAIYVPWNTHHIQVKKEPLEFRWLTLDGPLVLSLFESFRVPQTPHHVGPCPTENFQQLEDEIKDYATYGERHICLTAFNILMQACDPLPNRSKKDSMVDKAKVLIKENLGNMEMNINWLADQLKKNRSSFSRLFYAKEGIQLCQYITALRQQKAINLLKTTSLAIKEIAVQCGYSDPDYFSKVFHKTFKRSPKTFRKVLGKQEVP